MGPNPQFLADLGTFTEEILNAKLNLLCNEKQPDQSLIEQFQYI